MLLGPKSETPKVVASLMQVYGLDLHLLTLVPVYALRIRSCGFLSYQTGAIHHSKSSWPLTCHNSVPVGSGTALPTVKNQSCDFSSFMEGEHEPQLAADCLLASMHSSLLFFLLDGLIVM